MITKIIFWGEIFEMAILMDVFVLRFPETENHIFNGRSVCVWLLSAQLKNKLYEAPNLEFYILIHVDAAWNLYFRMNDKVCVQGWQKKYSILWSVDWFSYWWILIYFDCTKYNEINIHFFLHTLFKNIQTTEYGVNTILNLSVRPHKRIRIFIYVLI